MNPAPQTLHANGRTSLCERACRVTLLPLNDRYGQSPQKKRVLASDAFSLPLHTPLPRGFSSIVCVRDGDRGREEKKNIEDVPSQELLDSRTLKKEGDE
jgi:hypothetical protein